MNAHRSRKEWSGFELGGCCIGGRCDGMQCECPCHPRHQEVMRMKDGMERAKQLANLIYEGGCQVAVETFEDGKADMREGTSAFAALVRHHGEPHTLSVLGDDPWEVMDGLVKRLEEMSVAKLHSKRQEAARAQKKLSEQIKAIEDGRPLPG